MKKRRNTLFIIISLIIIVSFLIFIDNNRLTISNYDFVSEKIPSSFDGFTIVHLSDLHNKCFGKNQNYLINKITQCSPNIIVFTGDIISRNDRNLKNAEIFIRRIVKICPVYYVEGNHEKYCTKYNNYFVPFLKGIGVTVLRNESVQCKSDGQIITLGGIMDPVYITSLDYDVSERRKKYISLLSKAIPKDDSFKILLSHRAEFFEHYSQAGADLIFSGHTHGGQIILPFLGGVFAHDQGFNPQFYAGKYFLDNSCMIVSRGLGNNSFIPRINNPPEIVCVKLKTQ